MNTKPILVAKNITKSFGNNLVLNKICLKVNNGQLVAIQGENGSGKSTLLNILSGALKQDDGNISVSGKTILNSTPANFIIAGVVCVFQFPQLFSHLTVMEHISTVALSYGIQRQHVKKTINEVLTKSQECFGLKLNPHETVSMLSEEIKQILEFSKIYINKPKLILIDETTSVFNADQSKKIIGELKRFCNDGSGVILVTHRIDEIIAFSDKAYELRKGIISQKKINQYFSPQEDTGLEVKKDNFHDNYLLKIKDVYLQKDAIHPVNLNIHTNEIIGITGELGSGYEEIATILAGLNRPLSGQVIFSQLLSKKRLGHEITYLGKNRKEDIEFPLSSLEFNLNAGVLKKVILDFSLLKKTAFKMIEAFAISPPDINLNIEHFSGGNKMKAGLARVFSKPNALLIVCDEPFTGIDNLSRSKIHEYVRKLCNKNQAIVIVSREREELLKCCSILFIITKDKPAQTFLIEREKS